VRERERGLSGIRLSTFSGCAARLFATRFG
jgi:hypothetical protein